MASIAHGTNLSGSTPGVSFIYDPSSYSELGCRAISEILLSVVLAGLIVNWTCNIWFHPLAKFPGPLLGRASLLFRFLHTSKGKFHVAVTEAHRKYGPIVRVAPNELSFASVESWKAIYGHPGAGREIAPKGPFYEVFAAGFRSKCVGSERDSKKHSAMRKMLNPAFSQRGLLEQEAIITGVVDKFVGIIGDKGGPSSHGINVSKWFEMNSFDILGEMAFGESFHSLDTGDLHFWAAIVLDHLYMITLIDNLRRIGWLANIFGRLIPSSLLVRNQNSVYSRQQVEKRLAINDSRNDFVSLLVEKVRAGEVGKEEMTAHVSTLTIAGGETVATTLASLTCFLTKNPGRLQRLVDEIRTAFKSFDEINATTAQQLPYLQAVLNEGLRLFPPASGGAPRVSPGFELHGYYIPPGTEINVSPWTITHDAKYFSDPWDFKPERWLDADSTDVKDASRPFLLGPRDCLGRNFAWMELNLVLAKMLWRYDLELVSKDIDWLKDSQIHVLWWKPKLFVRFHERAR
ncbi:cytochrome P450 [Hypoxylon sp. FL1284]|nr:cytochrome P450 [Hypoxylon sp. FL1284]